MFLFSTAARLKTSGTKRKADDAACNPSSAKKPSPDDNGVTDGYSGLRILYVFSISCSRAEMKFPDKSVPLLQGLIHDGFGGRGEFLLFGLDFNGYLLPQHVYFSCNAQINRNFRHSQA